MGNLWGRRSFRWKKFYQNCQFDKSYFGKSKKIQIQKNRFERYNIMCQKPTLKSIFPPSFPIAAATCHLDRAIFYRFFTSPFSFYHTCLSCIISCQHSLTTRKLNPVNHTVVSWCAVRVDIVEVNDTCSIHFLETHFKWESPWCGDLPMYLRNRMSVWEFENNRAAKRQWTFWLKKTDCFCPMGNMLF